MMKNIVNYVENRKDSIGILSVDENSISVKALDVSSIKDLDELIIDIRKHDGEYKVQLRGEEDTDFHKVFDNDEEVITCIKFNVAMACGDETTAMLIMLDGIMEELNNL